MQTKIIPAIKEKCKVDGAELIFDESEETFGQKDSLFYFKSEKWTDDNICISFAFDKYCGNFYSGIGKLDHKKVSKKAL